LVLVERRRVKPATPDGYGLAWRIARLKAEPDLAAYAIEQGEACILEVHWNSRGAVQIQLPGGKRATLQ
jgi:hypothetical protein